VSRGNERAFIEGVPAVPAEPGDIAAQARAQTAQRLLSELESVRQLFEENLIPESMYDAATTEYKNQMSRYGLTDLIVAPTTPLTREERTILERGKPGEQRLTNDRVQALRVLVEVQDVCESDIVDLLGNTRLGRRFTTSQAASSLKSAVNRLIRDQKGGKLSKEAADLYELLASNFSDPVTGEFKAEIFNRIDEWRKGKGYKQSSPITKDEQVKSEKDEKEESGEEIRFDENEVGILAEFMLSKMGTTIIDHNGIERTYFRIPPELVEKVLQDLIKLSPSGLPPQELEKLRASTISKVCELIDRKDTAFLGNQDDGLKKLINWLSDTISNDPFLKANFPEFLSRRPIRFNGRKKISLSNHKSISEDTPKTKSHDSEFERRLTAYKRFLDEQSNVK